MQWVDQSRQMGLVYQDQGQGQGQGQGYGAAVVPKSVPPDWLKSLVEAKYFEECKVHVLEKLKTKFFCVDCGTRGCSLCYLEGHQGHNGLQVRQYMSKDVIKLSEMVLLLDCKGIQTNFTNNADVIHVHPPRPNPTENMDRCRVCHARVKPSSAVCSLRCKVASIANSGEDFGPYLRGGKQALPSLSISTYHPVPSVRRKRVAKTHPEGTETATSELSEEKADPAFSGSSAGFDESSVVWPPTNIPRRSRT
eukprot:TRINITY_DN39110_c0_g1_i1.p1 TRINITY_DN39110_c0_g1~~TRINITY_DN39110_c0_g1_i1.p1  ORF type:complete len:251 (+),score=37.37 TRINITY_DN39110_c0_g1_i1:187-939(+)